MFESTIRIFVIRRISIALLVATLRFVWTFHFQVWSEQVNWNVHEIRHINLLCFTLARYSFKLETLSCVTNYSEASLLMLLTFYSTNKEFLKDVSWKLPYSLDRRNNGIAVGCNLLNLFVLSCYIFVLSLNLLTSYKRNCVSFGLEIFTKENVPLTNWIFENDLTTVASGISNYRLILREPTN